MTAHREQAIELLSMLASQPTWVFGVRRICDMYECDPEVSALMIAACAIAQLRPNHTGLPWWRAWYLEAETLLRCDEEQAEMKWWLVITRKERA